MCGGGGTGIAARERIFIARLLRAKLFLHNGVATKSSSVDVWSVIIDKIKCVFAVELTIAARLGATGRGRWFNRTQEEMGRNRHLTLIWGEKESIHRQREPNTESRRRRSRMKVVHCLYGVLNQWGTTATARIVVGDGLVGRSVGWVE